MFDLYRKGDWSISNIFFHYEIHKEWKVALCQLLVTAVLLCVGVVSISETSLSFVGAVSFLAGLVLIVHLLYFSKGKYDWRNFIYDNFIAEAFIMAISFIAIILSLSFSGNSLLSLMYNIIYFGALIFLVLGFFGEGSLNVSMIEA